MVSPGQSQLPILDARLDLAQVLLVSFTPAFSLPGSFWCVAWGWFFIFGHFSIFPPGATILSLLNSSCSYPLQLVQLLTQFLLEVRSLLAPVLVDPALHVSAERASVPELDPTFFRAQ